MAPNEPRGTIRWGSTDPGQSGQRIGCARIIQPEWKHADPLVLLIKTAAFSRAYIKLLLFFFQFFSFIFFDFQFLEREALPLSHPRRFPTAMAPSGPPPSPSSAVVLRWPPMIKMAPLESRWSSGYGSGFLFLQNKT